MLRRQGMHDHFVQELRQVGGGSGYGSMAGIMQALAGAAVPGQKLLAKQTLEALQTGGVGARIPIIQRAVEAASAAGGQVSERARQLTARAGLAGSPFDVASQLTNERAVSSAIAGIPAAAGGTMVASAGPTLSGITSQALTAGQIDLQRREFNIQMYGTMMEDIKSSIAGAWSPSSGGATAGGTAGGSNPYTGGGSVTQGGSTSGVVDYGGGGGTPDVSEFV
jgi:hypothetical protein